jgi:hypothetical protein
MFSGHGQGRDQIDGERQGYGCTAQLEQQQIVAVVAREPGSWTRLQDQIARLLPVTSDNCSQPLTSPNGRFAATPAYVGEATRPHAKPTQQGE